jgi:hypothetical protein
MAARALISHKVAMGTSPPPSRDKAALVALGMQALQRGGGQPTSSFNNILSA